jgi:alkyl hydroperoxide reductase subunit AhpF
MKSYGLPSGNEFSAVLEDVADAVTGSPKLSEETLRAQKRISSPIHMQVFVTPSCPYCPRVVARPTYRDFVD